MSTRNSKLILAKGIKLNKNYTEVLSYKENEMVTLLRTNLVNETSDFSYLSPNDNYIDVNLPYSVVAQSNYIGFENPYFNNKWYFAFLDEIEYISDKVTRIHFIIDYFSTWFDYWSPKDCFIIRQHATSDTVGANLVDEDLSTGEYTLNGDIIHFQELTNYVTYVQASAKASDESGGSANRGGVYVNSNLMLDDIHKCTSNSQVRDHIAYATNSTRKVLNCWLVPSEVSASVISGSNEQIEDTFGVHDLTEKSISMVSSLNGYTPANKKLLTYPYVALILNNLSGKSNTLRYEEFTGARKLGGYMIATPGCPGMVFPCNYKGWAQNLTEGINTADVPVVAYETDAYREWLANNTFANKMNTLESAGKIGLGGAILMTSPLTGGTGALVGGAMALAGISNAFNMMMTDKQAQMLPNSYFNNNGSGNLLLPLGLLQPLCIPVSIKYKTAQRIDEYFTRYGYATNELATPNITHRSNYNYIRVSNDSSPCIVNNHNNISVPQKDLEFINTLFRNGITIWHNHNNLGNYAVTNTIV